MPELDDIARIAVEAFMKSPEATTKIAAVVKKECESAIENALRWNTPFAKAVGEAVNKALVLHGEIDLPSYNDTILKIVENCVKTGTEKAIERQVAERMKELLTPAPEKIKLSELLEQYREQLKDHDYGCECDGEKHFVVELADEKQGFFYVRLNEEKHSTLTTYKTWDIQFGIHLTRANSNEEGKKYLREGELFSLSFKNAETEKKMFIGPIYNFERSIFQMKAAKTKVIIDREDADEVNTNYGHEYD